MGMSEKDYKLIANAIKTELTAPVDEDNKETYSLIISSVAEAISNALETDNPRFDKITFLLACGCTVYINGAKLLPLKSELEAQDQS